MVLGVVFFRIGSDTSSVIISGERGTVQQARRENHYRVCWCPTSFSRLSPAGVLMWMICRMSHGALHNGGSSVDVHPRAPLLSQTSSCAELALQTFPARLTCWPYMGQWKPEKSYKCLLLAAAGLWCRVLQYSMAAAFNICIYLWKVHPNFLCCFLTALGVCFSFSITILDWFSMALSLSLN